MADHLLVVPPQGILHVIHSEVGGVDEWATLNHYEPEGPGCYLVTGDIEVKFKAKTDGLINPRARWVMAELTGVHMLFVGAVMFMGIGEDEMSRLVAALSSPVWDSEGRPAL